MIVERWRTRFQSPRPLPAQAVSDWHALLGDLDEHALLADLAGADEWLFVDRLRLRASWRPEAGHARLELQGAMRAALCEALADPARVVRYASRRQAWADLLYRAAQGDCARAWAWSGMGLLPASMARGAEPERILSAAVTGLAFETDRVWPVLRQLLAAEPGYAAFSALLRALPEPGWRTLFAAAPATAPYLATVQSPSSSDTASGDASAAWDTPSPADPAGLAILLDWVRRQPWLAHRHAGALAPLLAALAWRAAGASTEQRAARLRQAYAFCKNAVHIDRATPRATLPQAPAREAREQMPPPGQAAHRDAGGPAAAAVADVPGLAAEQVTPMPSGNATGHGDEAPAPLPDLPVEEAVLHTKWAGALFWLPRLRHGLGDDADMAKAPQGLLAALADRLGIPAIDPVRRILHGDAAAGPVPDSLMARADALCHAWEAWLAEQAPDLPPPRLDYVCRRPGRLRIQPGWIEVVMPLDGVDTHIRRLGLDLDPGWLPWLGYVLRYRYE